jgi:hypothetical protein
MRHKWTPAADELLKKFSNEEIARQLEGNALGGAKPPVPSWNPVSPLKIFGENCCSPISMVPDIMTDEQ